jgi:hypothetical protein
MVNAAVILRYSRFTRAEEAIHMRKVLLLASILGIATLVAIPPALIAHPGSRGSGLDRQVLKYRERNAATSSTKWSNLPGIGRFHICAVNEVSAQVNLVLRGAPVRIRIRIDGADELIAHPGPVTFRPGPGRLFSFTFAEHVAPFEAEDFHAFEIQWRSPTGERVVLKQGMVNLLFERGFQGLVCAG